MSTVGGYVPSAATATGSSRSPSPLHPSLAAIEAAAEPDRRSRSSIASPAGSCPCSPPAGDGSSRSAPPIGYSTLWLALGQPAGGDDRDDRPGPRRGPTSPAAGGAAAGIADERIVVVNRPALEALRRRVVDSGAGRAVRPRFIDALKDGVPGLRRGARPAARPGALVVADNVLWSGQASGDRPYARGSATESPPGVRHRRCSATRASARRSCRSATAC